MTLANAQGAFRASGIFPVNVKAIPDHAYDPCTTTERINLWNEADFTPSSGNRCMKP